MLTHNHSYSGFDTGVVSGALFSLSQDPTPLPFLTTTQESFLVTSALIGALVSSLFAGRLADSDKLGRKGVIVISAVLFSLGAAEMAAAQVYKEIILGELLLYNLSRVVTTVSKEGMLIKSLPLRK
jgi:SP family myo-inositol transporter-like MFS transporter 13